LRSVLLKSNIKSMPEHIDTKIIDGRIIGLKKFNDKYVIYRWPTQRSKTAMRIEELGIFNSLEEAQNFLRNICL